MIKRPENLMLLPYFPMKFVNGGGQLKTIDYQPYLTCEQAFHGALFALPSESLNRELARRPNNTKHSCYLSISRIPRRLDYQPLFGKWARATPPEIEHTTLPCRDWCLKLCNELGLNLKPRKVNHHIVCVNCRRNQNFLDILSGLNLGQKGVFGITHQFHHVFWFGDLNYRIDLDVKVRAESIICGSISTYKFLKELVARIW